MQERPEIVGALVEQGVLVQLTARSLDGGRDGRGARCSSAAGRTCWPPTPTRSTSGRPISGARLRQAVQALPHAAAELEWMVTVAPRAILDGRPLGERPPPPARRRRRLRPR